jgi:hypothetical protein
MVAAEALATGLPVAATRSGGVEEILGEEGRCGELASGTDDAALADAIERLLDRRAGLDPVALRAHVASSYGPATVAGRVMELYRTLVEQSAQRPSRPPGGVAEPEPLGDGRHASSLVVAFDRTRLERRLGGFPVSASADLTIVTGLPAAAPSGLDHAGTPGLPVEARVVVVDLEAGHRAAMARLAGPRLAGLPELVRRPLRILLGPRAALGRRRLMRRREVNRRLAGEQAVLEAWRALAATTPSGPTPWLVACDADDLRAAGAALSAGARLAPGGIRWLADRASRTSAG